MDYSKRFFFLFFVILTSTSCGKKISLDLPTELSPPSWVASYRAFHRENILTLQAKIILPQIAENFDFQNLKINIVRDGKNLEEYKNEIIYKRKNTDEIEVAIFPFKEELFFKLPI